MEQRPRDYEGAHLTVRYDVKRCIHAERCIHGLPAVFEATRRPWIDPDAAPVEEVVEVVMRCPTGALHVQQEGWNEPFPLENTIHLEVDGPLYLRGNLNLHTEDGTLLLHDTRMALCRCGASKNKPLCDGSHHEIDFRDAGLPGTGGGAAAHRTDLRIVPTANGPYHVQGLVHLYSAEGTRTHTFGEAWLCRCGASQNKPFCDGSHRTQGFTAA
jgi:CDGSH-type Zn-finger protein/uncharacterized Fe-S cluster protein YjdI